MITLGQGSDISSKSKPSNGDGMEDRARPGPGRTLLVQIKYFASMREQIGLEEEERVLPPSVTTLQDLVQHLKAQGSNYAAAFADEATVRAAIDQEHADLDTPLQDAREIAFFPPMTGG